MSRLIKLLQKPVGAKSRILSFPQGSVAFWYSLTNKHTQTQFSQKKTKPKQITAATVASMLALALCSLQHLFLAL